MFYRGRVTKGEDRRKEILFSASGRVGETIEERQFYGLPGFMSIPEKDDELIIQRMGSLIIATAGRSKNEGPESEPGERVIFLNENTYLKIFLDGSIHIVSQKKEIFLDGDLTVSGEVTAKSKTAPVSLSGHLHPHPMGPTLKPTPGT